MKIKSIIEKRIAVCNKRITDLDKAMGRSDTTSNMCIHIQGRMREIKNELSYQYSLLQVYDLIER